MQVSTAPNKLFKNVERLQSFPRCWKDATGANCSFRCVAIKEDMQVLMNYTHEVLLLNIDRKLIEKVLYDPLCCNFLRFPLQKAERIRMWKASSF